jgi:2'-5' RNA ligase
VRAQDLVPLRETLRQACAGEPALTLGLAGLGVFPDARNPRVLWLGVTRDLETLAKIHSHVVAATTGLGEPEEARDFHPHLTLARLSIAPSEARLVTRALASVRGELPGEWEVNSVELVRSELRPEGARYSRLELFPLGNATSRVATGR